MNLAKFEAKLLAAGRSCPPSSAVPYAFEQRVLALIRSKGTVDPWGLWARALWRAAAPCVALTFLLSAWSFLSPGSPSTAGDLSQELEMAVLETTDPESGVENTW